MYSRPIYCLGPAGTNAHQVALVVREDEQRVAFCKTNAEVMRLAATGRQVVVPIENRGGGGLVSEVIQEWITGVFDEERPLPKITGEYILPVSHCIMAHPSALQRGEFTRVMSHAQAFSQSEIRHRGLTYVQENSTAEAAKKLAENESFWANTLVLASPFAAKTYNLVIIDSDREKYPWNVTRFHVLNGEDNPSLASDRSRSALLLKVINSPGSLAHVLSVFARAKINVSVIHSIDITGKGAYVFYLEIDANARFGIGADVIEQARRKSDVLRLHLLGAYRRAQ